VQYACDTLHTNKTRQVYLEVAADNAAALGLYARHGFAPCGRRANYYRADTAKTPVDALLMSRAL
jgi:ribosomal-protein-alanine N-acetyltransferase